MPTVGIADVLAYAESNFGPLKCPMCGSREFAPAAPSEDEPIALLYENSGRSWFGPPGYLRVYALSCTVCSFVATFKLDAIEQWLSERDVSPG